MKLETVTTTNKIDADFVADMCLESNTKVFESMEFRIDNDHVLAFAPDTFMRKDSTQVIFYGREFLDTWSACLMPQQAVLLAYFDGTRTLKEVAAILAEYTKDSLQTAELKVEHLLRYCEVLGKRRFVDLTESPGAPHKGYDPRDFAHLTGQKKYSPLYEKPISMMWMPTFVCQTDCVYCYAVRKTIAPDDLLSLTRVHELVEEAAKLGIIAMNVDGGDAFCRRNVTEIFSHATSLDIQLDVSTKAYISKDFAKELRDSGVKALQVGFDAPYPDLFDRIVGRKGHFQRTVESIHNCADAGILVRTNSILTSESVKYINELVEFLYELPLFNMKIAAAFRSHYRGNTSILLDEAQKQWLRSQMIALREKHPDGRLNFECKSDYMHLSPEERAQEFRDFPTCGAGSQSIIITPNGDVVMCEQSPQIEEFIVGNVKTRSILDVWSSPNSREFKTLSQKQFAGTACADCGDFERCYIKKGGCLIETIKAYGSRFNPHPACPKAPEYAPPIR